jgi:hypothetical protein
VTFTDTTDGAISPGALSFLDWANNRLTWADVGGPDETSPGLARKDMEAARGKRLCLSGSIIQIEKAAAPDPPVYVGGLTGGDGAVSRFIAIGDTGEIVANSPARICAFVVGIQAYQSNGGMRVDALFVMGMFDLPKNRARGASAASNAPPQPAQAETPPLSKKVDSPLQ